MAKSEYKNADNNWTGQRCIDLGRRDYNQAMEMEDNEDSNQKAIDATWGSSTKYFFYALVLGHNDAPRCLAVSFNQGTGVTEDKYMAALMFGIAKELRDLKCATTKNMPAVPKFMNPAISAIAKLIKETQAKIPATGIDADKFIAQMDIFEDAIALSSGRLISTFFTQKDTSEQSIMEFKGEHPGWVYHDAEYYQRLMEAPDEGGGAAAGGANSHLAAAFSDLHH